MKVRAAELEVPQDNPFANCKLGRGALAEPLTSLVANATEGMVMSIHAPWGQGKSTFFKMWHRYLVNEGFVVVQFNAWETDYAEDPMTALVGEMLTQWEDAVVPPGTDPVKADIFQQQVVTAKRVLTNLAKSFVPMGIRVASAGLIEGDGILKAVIDGAADAIDANLKSYVSARETIEKFRSDLSELAQHVKNYRDGKPLVFLVDELDRCRPDYALRVLECIKHFFSVSGVVFVLGIDRNQLRESTKTQYGQGMEASDYLRRFIDLDFSLPMSSIADFAMSQLDTFGILDHISSEPRRYVDHGEFTGLLPMVLSAFRCNPRDVQRLMGQFNFVLRTWPTTGEVPLTAIFFTLAFRLKAETLYASSVNTRGESLWTQLRDSLPSVRALTEQDESVPLEALVLMMTADKRAQRRYVDQLDERGPTRADPHSRPNLVLRRMFQGKLESNWCTSGEIRNRIDLSAFVDV